MIIVNGKTYPSATGDNAITLAQICSSVQQNHGVPIIPALQTADIWHVKQTTEIPIWSQHIDANPEGAQTGYVTIESVRATGASGTILNHSEHPLSPEILKQTIERIKAVDPSFVILVCVRDMSSIQQVVSFKPDYIAYEPPELIGSTMDSVATKYADVISQAVTAVKPIPLLVGAGIKDASDVRISLEKGATGILVSSAVVTTSNPQKVLNELAKEFVFYLKKQAN